MIVWDCLAWLLALGIFTLVRYDFILTAHQWAWTAGYCATAVLMQIVLGLWSQIYLGRSRVGSFSEATWIGGLVLLVGLPLGLILTLVAPDFPRGVAFMLPPLALVFMAVGRWVFRIVYHAGSRTGGDVGRSVPVLLYGAGEAGHQVATLIDTSNEYPYRIVGFVDDDPSKRYLRVNGHKVLGTGKDVVRIAREHHRAGASGTEWLGCSSSQTTTPVSFTSGANCCGAWSQTGMRWNWFCPLTTGTKHSRRSGALLPSYHSAASARTQSKSWGRRTAVCRLLVCGGIIITKFEQLRFRLLPITE